ncbi:MAG: Maf family protein [Halioglobus sp.]|nr:Maf family protein [Halioglobus sp.]
MAAPQLILASASPRRRQLLEQIGVHCECAAADIDESRGVDESPRDYVARLAREKAREIAQRPAADGVAVLAADTTVVLGDEILGKPVDRGDALGMLARLSGREHEVLTAICLVHGGDESVQCVRTSVEFNALSLQMCDAYLATDEPWDKAGAYAIQGIGAVFVRAIHGSYSNVVGLPLAETWQLLSSAGIETALGVANAV